MKYVIVSGASRGIGLETVKALLEEGVCVAVLSRSERPSVKHENLTWITMDITSEEECKTIPIHLKRLGWSAVDGLVHNAGSLVAKVIDELSLEEVRSMYAVNVYAPIMLTKYLLSLMQESKQAHVVGISSMGGFQGAAKFPGLSAYSSSKAAMACLIECWAEEWKGSSIAANALAIGAVQTDMLEEAFPGYEAPVVPATMGRYIANFVMTGHHLYNGKVLPVSLSTP